MSIDSIVCDSLEAKNGFLPVRFKHTLDRLPSKTIFTVQFNRKKNRNVGEKETRECVLYLLFS